MKHPPLPAQEEIPSTSAVLEALAKKWHPAPAEEEITPTAADDIQVENTTEETLGIDLHGVAGPRQWLGAG